VLDRLSMGLSPRQIALVALLFLATSIGAFVLAWWFRRRNRELDDRVSR